MKPGNPWHLVANATDRGDRFVHQRHVVKSIKKSFPHLYAGECGIKLGHDDVDRLVAELTHDQSSLTGNFRLKYLNSVLRRGIREFGWQIPMAPIPTAVSRDPSPFTAKIFSQSGEMRCFEGAFIESLAVPMTSIDARAGQMLISAILFGGLLCAAKWDNWLAAANKFDGRSVSIISSDDAAPSMRWFADPVTSRLLARWCMNTDPALPQEPKRAWSCIRSAMAGATFDGARPASAGELRAWAELRLRTIVPGYLVDYASRGGPSVSLPDSAWKRLLTGRRTVRTDRADGPPSVTVLSSLTPAKALAPRDAVKVLRLLRSALRVHARGTHKTSRAAAASAIEKVIESYGPAAHTAELILKWAHVRLVQPPRDGGLKPESVARYLTPLALPLLAFAGSDDWSQFEGEDVAELFLGIIASQETDAEKAMAGRALANFHDVVVCLFPSLAMDMSEFRPASTRGRVNANIVTGPEYLNAKRKLLRNSMSWRERIPGIVLILGYRAGLRRNEVFRLPLSCLRINHDIIELTIRKTRFGGLKSPAGTRRLPLGDLLDANEAVFLRKWLTDRPVALISMGEQLLFCDGSDSMASLPEAEVFDPIRAALVSATGDPNIRFHNLRHSFATFLLLILTVPPELNLGWLKGVDAESVLRSRRDLISLALLGAGHAGRAVLHAVSQACGHSDVRVTLASYMHLADLALWSLLSRESVQPKFSTEGKAAFAEITQSAVRIQEHRRRKTKGMARSVDPARLIDEATPTLASHRADPSRKVHLNDGIRTRRSKSLVKMKPAAVTHLPAVKFIQDALEALHAGITPEDCARSLSGTVAEITRWFQRARDLDGMRTQKGGFRHRSVGKATIENSLFPSAAIEIRELAQAQAMWARISATTDGVEQHSAALCLFAQRFQSTGSKVRIDDHREHNAYKQFLAALGVAKARIVWTTISDKSVRRSRRAKAMLADKKCGYFTVKSAGDEAASAGFHYVARMLIIAGKFSFLYE